MNEVPVGNCFFRVGRWGGGVCQVCLGLPFQGTRTQIEAFSGFHTLLSAHAHLFTLDIHYLVSEHSCQDGLITLRLRPCQAAPHSKQMQCTHPGVSS